MDSKVWGQYAWYTIHQLTLQFPQTEEPLSLETRQHLDGFFRTFQKILPCPICREHFSGTIQKTPPMETMKTGLQAGHWGVNAHNVVNRGLQKTQVGYEEAVPLYQTLDHGKIGVFLHIMFLTKIECDVSQQKELLEHLLALFPGVMCRLAMEKYIHDTKTQYDEIKTQPDFMKWASGLIMVYRVALRHQK